MPSAAQKALLQSALLALGLLVGLELLAGLAPQAPPPPPSPGSLGPSMGQTLPGNPHLLWELAPGDWPVEGGRAHINALGMRDIDRGPPTRRRALVLGDSSIFGFGVDQDEVFTHLLEERLGADVINAGVPGWSTVQAINMLELRGLALQPDLLIIASLWSDNNFDQFVDSEVITAVRRSSALRELLERSALFRRVDGLLARTAGRGARTVSGVAAEQPRGRRRVPLNTYAQNLEAMARRMHADGGGVAFVMLANRADMQHRPGPKVWQPYRDAMRQVATRWGAPLVDLPARFPQEGGLQLILDEMHPNRQGHAVIARLVEEALVAAGWPAQALRLQPPAQALPTLTDPFEGEGVALDLVEPARGGSDK